MVTVGLFCGLVVLVLVAAVAINEVEDGNIPGDIRIAVLTGTLCAAGLAAGLHVLVLVYPGLNTSLRTMFRGQ